MAFTCCYCEKPFRGKNSYCVPEGYARNPSHDGKPLCDGCGGKPEPSLDEICRKLDLEVVRRRKMAAQLSGNRLAPRVRRLPS